MAITYLLEGISCCHSKVRIEIILVWCCEVNIRSEVGRYGERKFKFILNAACREDCHSKTLVEIIVTGILVVIHDTVQERKATANEPLEAFNIRYRKMMLVAARQTHVRPAIGIR